MAISRIFSAQLSKFQVMAYAAFLSTSCGNGPIQKGQHNVDSTSAISDVGYQSGDGGLVTLYWRDSVQIYKAQCFADRTVLRHNCAGNRKQAHWPQVEVVVLGDLPETTRTLQRDRDALEAQLAAIDAELQRHPNDVDLTELRRDTAASLNRVIDQQNVVANALSAAQGFLDRLSNDRIVYSVKPGQTHYTEDRKYLNAIDRLFGGNADPVNPQPDPTDPADPVGPVDPAKPVTFFGDPYRHDLMYLSVHVPSHIESAHAVCASVTPNTWGLLHVDFDDKNPGQPRIRQNEELGRLLASAMVSDLPLADDGNRYVWLDAHRADGAPFVLKIYRDLRVAVEVMAVTEATRAPIVCQTRQTPEN